MVNLRSVRPASRKKWEDDDEGSWPHKHDIENTAPTMPSSFSETDSLPSFINCPTESIVMGARVPGINAPEEDEHFDDEDIGDDDTWMEPPSIATSVHSYDGNTVEFPVRSLASRAYDGRSLQYPHALDTVELGESGRLWSTVESVVAADMSPLPDAGNADKETNTGGSRKWLPERKRKRVIWACGLTFVVIVVVVAVVLAGGNRGNDDEATNTLPSPPTDAPTTPQPMIPQTVAPTTPQTGVAPTSSALAPSTTQPPTTEPSTSQPTTTTPSTTQPTTTTSTKQPTTTTSTTQPTTTTSTTKPTTTTSTNQPTATTSTNQPTTTTSTNQPPTTTSTTTQPTTTSMSSTEELIRNTALDGGAALADPNSSQSQALKWLENSAFIQTNPADRRIIQRYVLATLYFSTNGPGWGENEGWVTDNNECDWHSVSCNWRSRVNELSLANNNLVGTLPPDLALLTNLGKSCSSDVIQSMLGLIMADAHHASNALFFRYVAS